MSDKNPLILDKSNIDKYINTLERLFITKDETKPTLIAITAPWCGYCTQFKNNAWKTFKDMHTASSHIQMIEIDDTGLSWLSTNHANLHRKLILEPPRVYFPMVYMVANSKKIAYQPDYTPTIVYQNGKNVKNTIAFDKLSEFADRFVQHRKTAPRLRKSHTGGTTKTSGKKTKPKVISTKPKRNMSMIKQSLKAEIDAAFKKLMLQ
jgi:hypothetical protein